MTQKTQSRSRKRRSTGTPSGEGDRSRSGQNDRDRTNRKSRSKGSPRGKSRGKSNGQQRNGSNPMGSPLYKQPVTGTIESHFDKPVNIRIDIRNDVHFKIVTGDSDRNANCRRCFIADHNRGVGNCHGDSDRFEIYNVY